MLINGIETVRNKVTIEVSPEDALVALTGYMLQKVGLYSGCERLQNKIVRYYEEYGGSHSWTDCKVVEEDPTLIQLTVVDAVNKFIKDFEEVKRFKKD